MSHDFVTTTTVATPAGTISGSATETADALISINATLAIATDAPYDLAFKYDELKSIVIKSAVACTLEFNDGTTGVPTIPLTAGEIFEWHLGGAYANPFTEDITVLYVTAAETGAFQLEVLHDPTD